MCADEKGDNHHPIGVEADLQTSDAKYIGWSEQVEDTSYAKDSEGNQHHGPVDDDVAWDLRDDNQ